MKLLSLPALTLLAYGGLTAAQNCVATALSVIPSCAQNCILNGATTVGCGGTDFSCQCQKTAALYAAVDECVSSSCPSASYQAVIDGASTVCDCALPSAVAGVAGTASVSGISAISGISGIGPYSGTVPASNTATATATATGTGASTTATAPATGATSGSAATGSSGLSTATSSGGSEATWTGYTSVSNFATASVIGAAAQATPAHDAFRYVVLVVMVGAAVM